MAERTVPLRARLRYWFDNTMARGTPALIGWLTVFCLVIVVPASAALVWADKDTPTTLSNQVVEIWKNVSKTFKLGGALGTPAYVALSVLLAVVALFFASTLVGLITTGVNRKIMALRLGKSAVLEERHTVLLGWSDQVYPVISELVEANANRRRAAVALLADRDKVAMETDIHANVRRTHSTRVICRTGNTADPTDVGRVGIADARAVLVLTPGEENGDAQVIKSLLAVNAVLAEADGEREREGEGAGERGSPYIVAAVRNGRHHAAACLAAGDAGRVLNIDDVTARLIVQTSRQTGLSLVYAELLDFAGDEFYTVAEPRLVGRSFGEAVLAYDTSSVVGLVRAGGDVAVNPAPDTRIEEGDQLIVVTADDDSAVLSGQPLEADEELIVAPVPREPVPERILVLGWNRRAPLIIEQLDSYVAPGSVLDVVARGERGAEEAGRIAVASGLKVTYRSGETDRPEVLEELDVGSYGSVVVLGYEDEDGLTGEESDGDTLVTLLHLRALEQRLGRELPVVTEMADDRNRSLAPISEGADFIVSGKIISQLMTQVAENHRLAGLFRQLGSAEGSEIYLKPAGDYVRTGHETPFATVVESARRQGQCAIGHRIQAEATLPPAFGVRLNPDKRKPVTFAPGDCVIVVAQD
ncbi:TrkA C-terminal domain-containing protein [Streptomyces sp. NPDC059009]|uniref:CASTOR/POLLUX-related putative ion channel n=1 Tax=Streptomyces sp. NPDC059009 TaxID=3346694 RepID=UPI0036C316E0